VRTKKKKLQYMEKLFKIVIIILAVLIIAVAIVAIVIFGDIVSYTATGVEIKSPTDTQIGKALVVYDPGLSGAAKNAAENAVDGLASNGYEVTFAGVRSAATGNTSDFNVIVVGGPIYGGKPVSSIQGYLNGLNPPANATIGVFGIGSGTADSTDMHVVASEVAPLPSDSPVALKTAMKIATSENLDSRCQEFITDLLQ
jgi:flavorubredoxin